MATRRTIRDFAPDPVPAEALRHAIRAAATAPSGANIQPWRFVVVTDPGLKRSLREGAEAEERRFYAGGAPQQWLDALAPLGTKRLDEVLVEMPPNTECDAETSGS
ncbi:MAG: nitroreductase family protein [Streptosporangiaceae bacterium]